MAESCGAIGRLGEWALRRACADAAALRRLPHQQHLSVHINVSGRQLDVPGFPAALSEVLDEAGLTPAALVVEVTETAVLDEPAGVQALQAIAAAGVRGAVDDFDTGYASLAYLSRFPVHLLKIDRSFTALLRSPDATRRRVARAAFLLGSSLGLVTVAEGIEQQDEAEAAHRAGSVLGQGRLYGHPAPIGTVVDALTAEDRGPRLPVALGPSSSTWSPGTA